jgi:hypothetical protein
MTDDALEFLRQRKAAYQLKFGSGDPADMVREDLAWFCHANRSCWGDDARDQARLEGRREVWLRIQQHLTMEPEELAELYGALRGPNDPDRDDENNPT